MNGVDTMDYTIRQDAATMTITINGPLELHSIKEFQKKVIELNSGEQKDIIIDLAGVDYIDSTGISVLIMLSRQQKEKGKLLKIDNPTQRVLSLLELSSLSELLPT